MTQVIKHKRNQNSVPPSQNIIDEGEIAIGFAANNEKLFIKNTEDEIVEFLPFTTNKQSKLANTNITFCTCSTAASTAAKVLTISEDSNKKWELSVGSIICVKFSTTNTASNPTFNVNNTGAKSVYFNTSKITTSYVNRAGYAQRYALYIYDGTYWVFLGWSYFIEYSSMSETEANNGTSTSSRLITPQRLHNKIIREIELSEVDTITSAVNESKEYTDSEISKLATDIVDNSVKIINHGSENTTLELLPNTFYIWDVVTTLDLALGAETTGVYNEYMFQFESGDSATTLILPDTITWVNGTPTIEPNKIYQCSIVNNIGVICGV